MTAQWDLGDISFEDSFRIVKETAVKLMGPQVESGFSDCAIMDDVRAMKASGKTDAEITAVYVNRPLTPGDAFWLAMMYCPQSEVANEAKQAYHLSIYMGLDKTEDDRNLANLINHGLIPLYPAARAVFEEGN